MTAAGAGAGAGGTVRGASGGRSAAGGAPPPGSVLTLATGRGWATIVLLAIGGRQSSRRTRRSRVRKKEVAVARTGKEVVLR